jgi:hypothetical protein
MLASFARDCDLFRSGRKILQREIEQLPELRLGNLGVGLDVVDDGWRGRCGLL